MIAKNESFDEQQTFRSLLRQMQDGSQEATRKIIQTYGPQIRSVVRRQMSQRVRSLYDSEEFAQLVYEESDSRQRAAANRRAASEDHS